jgi:hypothetical protein
MMIKGWNNVKCGRRSKSDDKTIYLGYDDMTIRFK